MGSHTSPIPDIGFVHGNAEPYFNRESSGDIYFHAGGARPSIFEHFGTTPDAIAYYALDCGVAPERESFDFLMSEEVFYITRQQTRELGGDEENLPMEDVSQDFDFTTSPHPDEEGRLYYLDQYGANKGRRMGWVGYTSEEVVQFFERILELEDNAIRDGYMIAEYDSIVLQLKTYSAALGREEQKEQFMQVVRQLAPVLTDPANFPDMKNGGTAPVIESAL